MTKLLHGLGMDWELRLPSPRSRTDALEVIGSVLCIRYARRSDQQCKVRKNVNGRRCMIGERDKLSRID